MARELLESEFLSNLDDEKNKESVKVGPSFRALGPKRESFINTCAIQEATIFEEEEEAKSENEGRRPPVVVKVVEPVLPKIEEVESVSALDVPKVAVKLESPRPDLVAEVVAATEEPKLKQF